MLSWDSTPDMAVSLAFRQSAMPSSAGFEIIPCSRWYSCEYVRFSIIFAHASMVPSRRPRSIFVTSKPFSAMTCLSHVHAAVDVDDAPELALDHRLQRRAGAVVHAVQVGVDHFGPVLVGQLPHRPVPRDPGVVHQDVQLTPLLQHGRDQRPRLVFDAHVAAEE